MDEEVERGMRVRKETAMARDGGRQYLRAGLFIKGLALALG